MSCDFRYRPSHYVPFRDEEVLKRCRAIKRSEIDRHPNPRFKIRVIPADQLEFIWIADMVCRMKASDDENKPVVLIVPNPSPGVYTKVAHMVNKLRINCPQRSPIRDGRICERGGRDRARYMGTGFHAFAA